jgi:hypothetical protein
MKQHFTQSLPVSPTNKAVCHDITEILLKVALNAIKQKPNPEEVEQNRNKTPQQNRWVRTNGGMMGISAFALIMFIVLFNLFWVWFLFSKITDDLDQKKSDVSTIFIHNLSFL